MEAKVEYRSDIYVVNLSGQMDFESADSLRVQCLRNFNQKNVIFNMRSLNFVGSSGITPFLQLLSELQSQLGPRFKICSVSNEFMRLFDVGTVEGIEIYGSVDDAERSFRSGEVQALAKLKPFGLKLSIE